MTTLKYRLTKDTLFKLLFTRHPNLLKRLISVLLNIDFETIEEFVITNPEISPEELGKRFCRLDINMTVNRQRVDLEVQVSDEGNYPERSLYYWAREFSAGLDEGEDYSLLPKTIIISILGFPLFDSTDFQSEYQVLEVNRHTPLTDRLRMIYFELPKLPSDIDTTNELKLWLTLFNAKTEEDLTKIEELEVSVMNETIGAYRRVAGSPELRAIERAMHKARHDEAQALRNAELRAELRRDEHWQGVVADKDALIAELQAKLEGSK